MTSDIRFLIASDIHAGYGENKKHINNDSFDSFEEVLKHGVENKVDFILLGGDLFHENNPSRETRLRVIRLLRRYCLRNTELAIEFCSDPSTNFPQSNFPTVNYEDENLNVGTPIFTIHGNHDDLSGKGLTALDDLHETGLINLFGKFNDVDHIEISPILIKKGDNKLAIYGISSQRDDRLCRAFMQESVKFLRPDKDTESWFSILVLHQNRPRRSTTRTTGSHLPLNFIPSFFDLVIWGHEHESLIEPVFHYINSTEEGFYIIQPGSTVATSLCREESVQKHCAVISVRGRKFKNLSIPLKTPRQVFVDELNLNDDIPSKKLTKTTVRQKNMEDEEIIANKIEQILLEAKEQRKNQPQPPLVRLKVTYSGKWLNIPPINGRRFGARYADHVANPSEMIVVRSNRSKEKKDELHEPLNAILGENINCIHSVEQMVEKYFGECEFNDQMTVLTEVAMARSIKEYSNAETTFTLADRTFSDSIKEQTNVFSKKLCQELGVVSIDNMDEDDLLKMVDNCVLQLKHNTQGTLRTSGNISLANSTLDASFTNANNTNKESVIGQKEALRQQQRDSEIMEEDLFSD